MLAQKAAAGREGQAKLSPQPQVHQGGECSNGQRADGRGHRTGGEELPGPDTGRHGGSSGKGEKFEPGGSIPMDRHLDRGSKQIHARTRAFHSIADRA